eukprot:scaffold8147_cov296-Prasinococcus_capsulatus_cf.AAC.2
MMIVMKMIQMLPGAGRSASAQECQLRRRAPGREAPGLGAHGASLARPHRPYPHAPPRRCRL